MSVATEPMLKLDRVDGGQIIDAPSSASNNEEFLLNAPKIVMYRNLFRCFSDAEISVLECVKAHPHDNEYEIAKRLGMDLDDVMCSVEKLVSRKLIGRIG